ncbi:hypothetical protein AHAS_Ahas12G0129900 [Arachis hypogaea]
MVVFGGKGLVSMVVQNYVEEEVHKHMAGLVGNYKGVHHSHHFGMHHRMVVGYSALEGVVAKRVDQILVTPPIFDCSNLDACSHCNFLFLQHNCDQTHSQRGESS